MVEPNLGVQTLADVAIDIATPQLSNKLFTYRVPDFLIKETFVGSQVFVPFGGQELVNGFVVGIKQVEGAEAQGNYKDIAELLSSDPLFDANYIDFLYWLADYYGATLASVIAAAVPNDFAPRLKRIVKLLPEGESANGNLNSAAHKLLAPLKMSKEKALAMNTLKHKSNLGRSEFLKQISQLRKLNLISVEAEATDLAKPKMVNMVSLMKEGGNKRQAEILSSLAEAGGILEVPRLLEKASTTGATLKKMAELGLIKLFEKQVVRDPMQAIIEMDRAFGEVEKDKPTEKKKFDLTDNQARVLETLSAALKDKHSSEHAESKEEIPWLLYGVTGSGKTEIYLRLIQEALDLGKSAMLLVPEISLTPQLAERLKSRFGDKVAIWHSALSPGERFDTWQRLRAGSVRVLLGARSAILANMPELGLIVMDEEHDGSYKQSSPSPRYQAKRVALEKARRLGAMLLLGSATPDVSTYFDAKRNNRILNLPERIHKQEMPPVELVDMRIEAAEGNRGIFSRALEDAIAGCLELKQQTILLINRRGFASYVQCQACGDVVKCRNCSVSMVLHHGPQGYLACHHCGLTFGFKQTCPSCQAPFLREYGLGTQRVEHDLKELFPEARMLRLDSDITQKRGAFEAVLKQFARGEADILIGTQMVAKGLDIANVTLVGVLAADAAFNLPDYRSIERGFQLLTQVAGRAGRGHAPGSVIMQTYNPEMPALNWAKGHDYDAFVQEELSARKDLEYPPFSQLIRLVISGEDLTAVEAFADEIAEELAKHLEDLVSDSSIKVLGPSPCLIERLKQNYRHQLIVKNQMGEAGRALVVSFLKNKKVDKKITLAIDVDAYDFV
ncbi:MAG: primosomal protein N' [Candidatus Obscuribacterales bacterium]|nr:primosomal protein N' [Candidatus Obscuribacterales bacterium]